METQDIVKYKIGGRELTLSISALKQYARWMLFASLAFIAVILVYDFMVGAMSYALNYTTSVHFGKVDSLPHWVDYWNTNRVLAMYLCPTVAILLCSILLFGGMALNHYEVNVWSWLGLWLMVFSILLTTTLMSLSVFSGMDSGGSLYQGLAVVMRWFDFPTIVSIILFAVSIIINIVCGIFCSRLFIYLAPAGFIVKVGRKSPKGIILRSFVLPILLLFAVAILLSFPHHCSVFVVMFLHACLWLPGLCSISHESLMQRGGREIKVRPVPIPLLSGATFVLIILVRVFLS